MYTFSKGVPPVRESMPPASQSMSGLVVLPAHELSDMIAEVVRTLLREEFRHSVEQKGNATTEREELMTRRQVSEECHVSLPTVDKWVRTGILRAIRRGRRTLFRRSDVLGSTVLGSTIQKGISTHQSENV